MTDRYHIWKRSNSPALTFVEILLVISFLGCDYTILKPDVTSKDPYEEKQHEEALRSEQRRLSLCRSWNGVKLTMEYGKIIYSDSIFLFTLNRDGTWFLIDEQGTFDGTWTFNDEVQILLLSCNCTERRDLNDSFSTHFTKRGLQLWQNLPLYHDVEIQWNLTPKSTVYGN